MEKRSIGSLSVSVVGLGCNNFGLKLDADASARVVHAALDAGINLFDTADVYGQTRSEEFLGRALGGKRDAVVLATKFGMPLDEQRRGARPEYVKQAIEASLKRLGTDRIDLYHLHKPDPTVPIADTLGALDELVKAGKVREIGSSNFSVEQIEAAERARPEGSARFVSVQNEYSLLHRDPERGVLAACAKFGIGLMPYFPLASGMLTGKYVPGEDAPKGSRLSFTQLSLAARFLTPRNLELAVALRGFAEARGHSLLELAFSWLLARPTVNSVIAGATSVEQVAANTSSAGWKLTAAELAEIDQLVPAS
jgi:aryl-alcohol dehydrogenase-like predicted oxidoreductase